MAAIDSGLADVALGAVETTTDSTVDTSAADTTVETTDSGAEDTSAEATDSTEGSDEINPLNEKGEAKTEAEIAEERAAASKGAAKEVLPAEARSALKTLKDLDPKYAGVVKTLHGAFERWEATKPLLGAEGVNGLKSFLADTGAKSLTDVRQTFAKNQEVIEAVTSSDELLHSADAQLAKNVYEDMKANGTEGNYGKVVGNFLDDLKSRDETAFYELTKPHVIAGLQEAGLDKALNSVWAALNKGDLAGAKAVLKATGAWFNELREEVSDKAQELKAKATIQTEKQKWQSEQQQAERTKAENSIAETCEKSNNVTLGKALGHFLKMPFFKDFPRETLIDLGNGIKERLYAALKADKTYQTQLAGMWKSKTLNSDAIVKYHNAKLEQIANDIVTKTVQSRYPNYAKGGSAAGKAAAAASAKTAAAKTSAASIANNKPVYVATRPTNLVRTDVTIGGKSYSQSDLVTMQIAGKGFVKTSDGKGYRLVTWRK